MKPQDGLIQSRLDSEMTPDEMVLERRLGEMLARPAPGADEAWRAALARIAQHEQVQRAHARRRRFAWAAVPAAVAAMALVVLAVGYARTETQPSFLSVSARDAAVQVSSVRAQEMAATARNLLRDNNLHMAFDPMKSLESADAPYRLVSVRRDEHAGEPVVEMVFMCGGKPAKVIITNGGGNTAHEISQASARGAALASRSVGDWLVTAVGVNAPDGLLSLVEVAQPEPQEQTSVQAAETPPTEVPTPESAVVTPETAPGAAAATPDSAVVAPETAIATPQAAPDAAPTVPETPVSPAAAPEAQPSPAVDNSEQIKAVT